MPDIVEPPRQKELTTQQQARAELRALLSKWSGRAIHDIDVRDAGSKLEITAYMQRTINDP
jgi:hypothetical protein